jgi:superfamily I DNA/RNA helicase
MGGMQWSQYQQAIFTEAARLTEEDCAVVARAGSGKTTSLLESLNALPCTKVLLCAFNKSIQTEMQRRAPAHVTCRTLHSLGLRLHQMNLARRSKRAEVKPEKGKEIAFELLKQEPKYYLSYRPLGGAVDDYSRMVDMAFHIRDTASYAKNTLATDLKTLEAIATKRCDLPDRNSAKVVAAATKKAMEQAADKRLILDFDDMIWFPWRFGYGDSGTSILWFQAIMVDEQQDLNNAQNYMIQRMRGGRVISFLDDRQCIYAFRGADTDAIAAITNGATKLLSLPISYRCPTAVVEQAQRVVPDIQPAPNAIRGTVEVCGLDKMLKEAEPDDFILSRTNAPLMSICLRLLRAGKVAIIAGRDIGKSLRDLVDKSKASDITGLSKWLDTWLLKEEKRLMPEYPDRYAKAQDSTACLKALMHACQNVQGVREQITKLFSDVAGAHQIVCSTVHKAKGLERDTVWMLSDTFGYPSRRKDSWSEQNIWYVAVTRARRSLYFVETPATEIADAVQGVRLAPRARQVQWR